MNWGTDSLLNLSEGIWNHIKARQLIIDHLSCFTPDKSF
jgi:hypothetical protein